MRNILDIVQELQDFECENKLDRVYALLRLEGRRSADYLTVKVDYTLSFPEMILDLFAKRYVQVPGRRQLDNLNKDLWDVYVYMVLWGLDLTQYDCYDMMRLVSAKLDYEDARGEQNATYAWAVIQHGLRQRAADIEEVGFADTVDSVDENTRQILSPRRLFKKGRASLYRRTRLDLFPAIGAEASRSNSYHDSGNEFVYD